jgi:hypothetical protein
VTAITRRRLPEEDELDEKRRDLSELELELSSAEADLADLRSQLDDFRRLFERRLAPLFADLDETKAEILRLRASRQPSQAAWEEVEDAEQRARDSRSVADEIEVDRAPVTPASEELRGIFREAARKVHPDLAADDEERQRRTNVMARVNAAYARRDYAAIERILAEESERPESVQGRGIAEELVRTIRRIAQARRRLAEVSAERERLFADTLWELFQRYLTGGDRVLDELEEDLRADLAHAKSELESLRREHA